MAKLLKGKPVADALVEQLRARVQTLQEQDVQPQLAIVRVGERADAISYERAASKRMEALGAALL